MDSVSAETECGHHHDERFAVRGGDAVEMQL
jgi:hypothetical protein